MRLRTASGGGGGGGGERWRSQHPQAASVAARWQRVLWVLWVLWLLWVLCVQAEYILNGKPV